MDKSMDEIRPAEALTDEEEQVLFSWGKDIFGVEALGWQEVESPC